MAYNGHLLQVQVNGTFVDFPLRYINYKTYVISPDQRMEWSAERDTTGLLHRETVERTPPKVEFNTPYIYNKDVEQISALLNSAYTDAQARKLTIRFYDMAEDTYKTWECYMPDVKYTIYNVDTVKNVILYEPIRYAFIGY